MKLTVYRLAKLTKIPPQRLTAIVHERRGVTADTDLRLCRFFGLSEGYWMRVQVDYELRKARHTMGKKIEEEVQPMGAA